MDADSLIEKTIAKLNDHVVIGTTHSETCPSGAVTAFMDEPILDPRAAAVVLRSAFAEVRLATLEEVARSAEGLTDAGSVRLNVQHMIRATAKLLPPAAEEASAMTDPQVYYISTALGVVGAAWAIAWLLRGFSND